jgi:hypothetical protein
MTNRSAVKTASGLALGAAGLAAASYGAVVGYTWAKYGRPARPDRHERDPMLDRFMPDYEVVERHHLHVEAPAELVLEVARNRDLLDSPLVRGIFQARQVLLGGTPSAPRMAKGMIDECLALGWVVLAESDREVVVGAVTRPWEANPTFRSVPPEEFEAFNEPAYVKIVWTLRADPDGPHASTFRTETRVSTTDAAARRKFRVYWAFFAAGVWTIRQIGLAPLKAEAEARYRSLTPSAA